MKDIHLFEPGPASWGIGCIVCKLPVENPVHSLNANYSKFLNANYSKFMSMSALKVAIRELKEIGFTDKEILELVEFNLKGK